MKRFILLFLASVICLSVCFYITGCGSVKEETNEPGNTITEQTPISETPEDTKKEEPGLPESKGLDIKISDDGKSCSIVSMGNCTDKNLVIPKTYNGVPVTAILPEAFRGNTQITEIWIPDDVFYIGQSAFLECSNLTKVHLPAGLKTLGYFAFQECTSLSRIEIPGSLDMLESDVFFGCTALTEVVFSEGTRVIGTSAFSQCTSLSNITFSSTIISLHEYAFNNCDSLTKVVLPPNISGLNDRAFHECSGLVEVTIPASINNMGWTFEGCDVLSDIHYEGTKEQWNEIKKNTNWHKHVKNSVIHCTDGDILFQES